MEQQTRARGKTREPQSGAFSKVVWAQFVICGLLVLGLFLFGYFFPKTAQPYLEEIQHQITKVKDWVKVKETFFNNAGKAMGGEDEDAVPAGKTYAAPKTASLANYLISEPAVVPVHGRISSRFGYRTHPIKKKVSFHMGLDIAAEKGTAIASAYYGEVEETGTSETYGNYVLMRHADQVETFYAHCSKVTVKQGDRVQAGDKIAEVGSTGTLSTGNHLHFEVRLHGIRYDPEKAVNPAGKDAL